MMECLQCGWKLRGRIQHSQIQKEQERNCNLKRTRDKKRRAQYKEVCFVFLLHLISFQKRFKQGKGERKCNANWYVNMNVLCIFILFKEISDNQAESNIPDLVQTISQSMKYMMVDIDEDAEEFSSRTLHLALQPTDSAPKFVLGSS